MPFQKSNPKEISAFRKSEVNKISKILPQLEKAETNEDVSLLAGQAMSALVKIQESTKGRLNSEWLNVSTEKPA